MIKILCLLQCRYLFGGINELHYIKLGIDEFQELDTPLFNRLCLDFKCIINNRRSS